MKFISSMLLCLAPIAFFADSETVQTCDIKDPFTQCSEDLKLAYDFLKNDQAAEANVHFKKVLDVCLNDNFTYKPYVVLGSVIGWAITLDQLDNLDELYKWIGKSAYDGFLLCILDPNMDIEAYVNQMNSLFEDENDDFENFIEGVVNFTDEDWSKLALKAKNPLLKQFLELNIDSEDDTDDKEDDAS